MMIFSDINNSDSFSKAQTTNAQWRKPVEVCNGVLNVESVGNKK